METFGILRNRLGGNRMGREDKAARGRIITHCREVFEDVNETWSQREYMVLGICENERLKITANQHFHFY